MQLQVLGRRQGAPSLLPGARAHTPTLPRPERTRFSALIGRFLLGPPIKPPGASPRRGDGLGTPRLGPAG